MSVLNKHFWKICGGFLAILAFGIGALISFEYWRGNEEKKELETLMKQADQEKYDTYKIERPDKNINENRP